MPQIKTRKRDLQERLLDQLLRVIAVAGVLAWGPSIYLSVKTGLWSVLVADTVAFGYTIVLALVPKIPYQVKIVSLLAGFYFLGLFLILMTGPSGAGHLFIFAFVFLMALFGDIKSMIAANAVGVLTHVGFTVATALHLLTWQQDFDSVLVISVNFVLISLILSVSANYLIQGYMKIAVSERELREVLEVMLGEIEHRVKNNLQVISSLINVRIRSSKNAASTLVDLKESLSAISAVHQLLYRQDSLYLVRVSELLELLFDHFRVLHRRFAFHFEWVGAPVEIDMDRAVSLGILINEIVINSVKHGFPDETQTGEIRLDARFQAETSTLKLKISDNGRGMASGEEPPGSGLKIIASLSKQLEALMEVSGASGVTYEFSMPLVSPALTKAPKRVRGHTPRAKNSPPD